MTRPPSFVDVPAPKPRYSLRAMFVVITALAVLLGTIFRAPDFIALPVLAVALVVLPILMVLGLRRQWLVGYVRAFSLGVLAATTLIVPLTIYWTYSLAVDREHDTSWASLSGWHLCAMISRVSAISLLAVAPILGALFVAIRWVRLLADVSLERAKASRVEG